MKKMIIGLGAIAIAIATQAASVDWATAKNTVTMHDGSVASGVTVYLLNASSTSYAKLLTDLASGAVKESTLSTSAAYLGSGTTGTSSKKVGLVSATSTSDSLTSGTFYDLVYLVFDKDTATNTDYFYVSSKSSGQAWLAGSETTQELATGASWDTTSAAGTWTAVPEPTSGLLMLLGMAGLALRRRRA